MHALQSQIETLDAESQAGQRKVATVTTAIDHATIGADEAAGHAQRQVKTTQVVIHDLAQVLDDTQQAIERLANNHQLALELRPVANHDLCPTL
ncbi:hypothetical protein [Halomonas sp. SpR8]|uniref:hypothetical protein n=1 Tax=Halomonas sp. SpR8 TaxID=3050463 RepID=UPI0027E42F52|nr:hypothetical protein [Halomonas sp. SpR8]MDQ7728830.1 hypothetical protein [Halomonas sp. SpR8]